MRAITIQAIALSLNIICAAAQRCGNGGGAPGSFDYYVLALSWAPGFCDTTTRPSERECGRDRHLGFVVHGLWPQYESGRSPEGCAPTPPVAHDLVDRMLNIMPDPGLIQHEWACHGTCYGPNAREYFGTVERAFQAVRVPDELRAPRQSNRLRVRDLERRFGDVNRASPDAFRVVCHTGELMEVRVCLTKDLKLRPCSSSVRECPANQVTVLPVP
jgi:ribonuclease T2